MQKSRVQNGTGQGIAVAPVIMDNDFQKQSSDGSSIDENAEVKIPKRLIF